MEREMDIFSGERNLPVLEIEAVNVAPQGLGFGEGKISHEARKAELGEELLREIESHIASPEILVPVSLDKEGNRLDDDGCGDGRVWKRIFEGNEERFKSLHRPKVFGGGATMAASTLVGIGKRDGRTLRETFSGGIAALRDKKIGFGAHTDSHCLNDPNNCGCGAIDKAPQIIQDAVKYSAEIRASIEALGIDTTGLDTVQANFADYVAAGFGDYSGQSVAEEIATNGKIVKELDDDHKEIIIVLNLIDGFTVDQRKIREISDDKAQTFAVDVWRMKEIADRLYADESEEVRHEAFLSELVYTLATAGTLTAGDLPVYVVNRQPELIAA